MEMERMTPEQRAELDEKIRTVLRAAVADGATAQDLAFLLTRILPEVCDRLFALGNVSAAYDLVDRRAEHRALILAATSRKPSS